MSELTYDKRGKVAWLCLCRPNQGNRLTPAMAEGLTALCGTAADDDEVELIVLTSTGAVFCQGLEYAAGHKGTAAVQEIQAQFGPKNAGPHVSRPSAAKVSSGRATPSPGIALPGRWNAKFSGVCCRTASRSMSPSARGRSIARRGTLMR